MVRILLVQPSSNIMKNRKEGKPALPPMNLMYLASYLRNKSDCEIEIMDVLAEGYFTETEFKKDFIRYGLSPEQIKSRIKDYNPDIIGVSCMVDLRRYHALEICELAKQVNPKIVTVIGGNPVTTDPKYFLNHDYVDFAILGEGEQPFYELCNLYNAMKEYTTKKSFEENTVKGKINGLAMKRKDGTFSIRPQKVWRKDLDNTPFPAHDLIDLKLYENIWAKTGYQVYKARKFSMSMMARGCPNKCSHCCHNVIFPGYRVRSAKNIFAEMEWAYSLGIREMQFHEYNGIVVWKIVEDFCNLMIKSGLAKKMRWGWPIGIWLKVLTRDKLKLMRKAGMDYLCLAIESYDQQKLDSIMKGKDVELSHVNNVIKWGREFGYQLHGFFMLGLEGQSKKDIEATINYAKHLNIDTASFFIAQPLPGSPLWDECVKKDLFLPGFEKFHLRYGKANTHVTGITPKELEHYRHQARAEFIKERGNEYQRIKEKRKYDKLEKENDGKS